MIGGMKEIHMDKMRSEKNRKTMGFKCMNVIVDLKMDKKMSRIILPWVAEHKLDK